ncbi:MAG: lytic transglycosylase domain-containing protein [Candidatus Pacearchaeota archaeon]
MKNLVGKLRGEGESSKNMLQDFLYGSKIARRMLKHTNLKNQVYLGSKRKIQNESSSNKSWKIPGLDPLKKFMIPTKTALQILIPLWGAFAPQYIGTSSTAENSEFSKDKNNIEQVTPYQENFIVDELLRPNENKEIKVTMPAWTQLGKFQRTYRWDDQLDKVENKYNIPTGTLKAIIMQESGGRVTAVSPDGGVGLGQFQPGTGRAYDLDVRGDSYSTGKDSAHGKRLSNLVEEYNHDYKKLSEMDERFDPEESIKAAGKFLSTLKRRHGTWDEAIERYNQGSSANGDPDDPYVTKIEERKQFYNKHDPTKPALEKISYSHGD